MKRQGVSYDVGCVMGGNWRPDYDPKRVHRELETPKYDLDRESSSLGITPRTERGVPER